jgi:outer membrane protein insertion porin family
LLNLRGVAAAALVAALCAVSAAQEQRVASVTVTGLDGEDLAAAQRAIRVRAGDLYSAAALQQDVVALLGLPFVLSAKAVTAPAPDGLAVTYAVSAKGRLAGVAFSGNRKFKDKKLRRIGNLQDVEHYDLAQLTEARRLITQEYKKAGYLFARVEFASQADGAVLFTIDEGRRMKVVSVDIRGNVSFDDAVLKKQVRTKTRRWLVLPYRLDADTAEDDRLRIQDYYRDRGYLDAKVGVDFDLARDPRKILVTYIVEEGPLYTTRDVAVAGNQVVPSDELLRALKMTVGTPFSTSRMLADVANVKAVYGRRGYIDAQVAPSTLFAEDSSTVSVVYRVQEGTPIAVGEVAVYGNDKTKDTVFRRELEFYPGETWNTDKVEESKRNIRRLDYASKVDIEPDPRVPAGASPRDAIVTVEETSTGQFVVGIGISSDSGVQGQIALVQRNFDYAAVPDDWRDIAEGNAFAGGGQLFALEAWPGSEVSTFSLRLRNPRVNDSRYSLGLGAHHTIRSWESYEEKRTGGDVTVGRRFTKYAFWEAEAGVDSVKIDDIEDDAPQDVLDVAGTSQVNTLGLTFGHDNRDSRVAPTEGHLLTATLQGSHDAIGSDFDFLRLRLAGNWYRLHKRDKLDRPFILSWRGRAGYIAPDGDAPIFERFFAGGSESVRGFEFRGVGPHFDDTALGGELMFTGGAEYTFPLVGDVFRGALFYDTGTVVSQPSDFGLDDLRHSVGFGVRMVIPPPFNAEISLDFGIPVKDEDEDETQVLSFTIGRGF